MAPPSSIPNLEVKHRSADGSVAIGHVRVGRCQFFITPRLRGVIFFALISANMSRMNYQWEQFVYVTFLG